MLGDVQKKQAQALKYAIEAIAISFPDKLKYWYDTQADRDQAMSEMLEHVRVLDAMKNEALENVRFFDR
jgi:hypothetical protein